jgi:hypothetical protein
MEDDDVLRLIAQYLNARHLVSAAKALHDEQGMKN